MRTSCCQHYSGVPYYGIPHNHILHSFGTVKADISIFYRLVIRVSICSDLYLSITFPSTSTEFIVVCLGMYLATTLSGYVDGMANHVSIKKKIPRLQRPTRLVTHDHYIDSRAMCVPVLTGDA